MQYFSQLAPATSQLQARLLQHIHLNSVRCHLTCADLAGSVPFPRLPALLLLSSFFPHRLFLTHTHHCSFSPPPKSSHFNSDSSLSLSSTASIVFFISSSSPFSSYSLPVFIASLHGCCNTQTNKTISRCKLYCLADLPALKPHRTRTIQSVNQTVPQPQRLAVNGLKS